MPAAAVGIGRAPAHAYGLQKTPPSDPSLQNWPPVVAMGAHACQSASTKELALALVLVDEAVAVGDAVPEDETVAVGEPVREVEALVDCDLLVVAEGEAVATAVAVGADAGTGIACESAATSLAASARA